MLGETIYLRKSLEPVVEINGKRWKLSFEFNDDGFPHNEESLEPTGRVFFEPTSEPLSQSDCEPPKKNRHGFHYLQLFGQPRWVQGAHYIGYKGRPCCHLVTIENCWGDMGNYNILIGLGDDNDPEVAYIEASCC